MVAYIAQVPLHILFAIHVLQVDGITDCDLYYISTSKNAKSLVEKAKETGMFRNVILLPNISLEYPITIKQIVDISKRRFAVNRIFKGEKYDTVYYNSDGWLLNSIIFSSIKCKSKNIFVENGLNPYITSYESKQWYLRLFINLSLMRCMDGRFINERYIFEPSLMQVAQKGIIIPLAKLDRKDNELLKKVNEIFDYDQKLDSFEKFDIIILEQGPRKEPIDMFGLWKRASECIPMGRAIVKSHPRQKEGALTELGYEVYDRYVIPWEVISLNQDMGDKTIISIFSTACVYPKILYGDEPRVILLYKLLGMDYSFFGSGMIGFVEGVKALYEDKDKFFIPETWDEFDKYCKDAFSR